MDRLVLRVIGSNFFARSEVRWNKQSLPTTFVSETELTALVKADRITKIGSAAISVYNPPTGGGLSKSLVLTIGTPELSIRRVTSITRNALNQFEVTFEITNTGTGPAANVQLLSTALVAI